MSFTAIRTSLLSIFHNCNTSVTTAKKVSYGGVEVFQSVSGVLANSCVFFDVNGEANTVML